MGYWVYADHLQNCDHACAYRGKVCVEGNFPNNDLDAGLVHDVVGVQASPGLVRVPVGVDTHLTPPSVYRFPTSDLHMSYSSQGRAPCNATPVESGHPQIEIHRYCGCES